MGKRNLNLELFVVVSWMNSWVSPFIIPDIICFGFFTLDTRMVKFFMKLGVKFHSFFLEKKSEILVPFTLFEKWKWNENDWKSRSRSESEIKMTRDRDREVKFQKKSREFSRIETLAGHCTFATISPLVLLLHWPQHAFQQTSSYPVHSYPPLCGSHPKEQRPKKLFECFLTSFSLYS